jgi:Na+-translocating ferredoxin:NAD+ oxidoreductase RNF subunit RnfB
MAQLEALILSATGIASPRSRRWSSLQIVWEPDPICQARQAILPTPDCGECGTEAARNDSPSDRAKYDESSPRTAA